MDLRDFASILFRPKVLITLGLFLFLMIFGFGAARSKFDKQWTSPTGNVFSTPEEACKDYIKVQFPGKNYNSRIKPTDNPDYKRCEYFADNIWSDEGVVFTVETPAQPTVSPTVDDICQQTPNGKWGGLENEYKITPKPGKDFSGDQKNYIRDAWQRDNTANNRGVLLSEDPNDPCNKPRVVNGKTIIGLVMPPTGKKTPGAFPEVDVCEAQVDHIIPAKLNGQNCGTNSFANARVVSQCVNSKKSNNPNFDVSKLKIEDCRKKKVE
jgi:hypothetical protein